MIASCGAREGHRATPAHVPMTYTLANSRAPASESGRTWLRTARNARLELVVSDCPESTVRTALGSGRPTGAGFPSPRSLAGSTGVSRLAATPPHPPADGWRPSIIARLTHDKTFYDICQIKMTRQPRQLAFVIRTHGGARPGAGRKCLGSRPEVAHRPRTPHDARHPVHVTLRAGRLPASLRAPLVFPAVHGALSGASHGIVHVTAFSVQADHVHLIVEADSSRGLTAGLQGLAIRVAPRRSIARSAAAARSGPTGITRAPWPRRRPYPTPWSTCCRTGGSTCAARAGSTRARRPPGSRDGLRRRPRRRGRRRSPSPGRGSGAWDGDGTGRSTSARARGSAAR